MDHGHGHQRSISIRSCTCRRDHVNGRIRLPGFVLAGFISSENVDFPYFGGPWMDYQCHSETTSNWIHYQFGVHYVTRPRPMQLSKFLDFEVQCEVLFHVELITIKHLDEARNCSGVLQASEN